MLYFLVSELMRNAITDITVSINNLKYIDKIKQSLPYNVKYVTCGWPVDNLKKRGMLSRQFVRIKNRVCSKIVYPILRYCVNNNKKIGSLRIFTNREFATALTQVDAVISTGGHHFTTILSRGKMNFQIYDLALANIFEKKTALWSQSIGPIKCIEPADEKFFVNNLRKVGGIYCRDKKSIDELTRLGVQGNNIHLTFESVLGLNEVINDLRPPSGRENIIGMAVYVQARRSGEEYNKYIKTLASFVDCVVDNGWSVRLFPHEIKKSAADDRPCLNDILRLVRDGNNCEILDEDLPVLDHLNKVKQCRLFVGHKTHSVIFALATNTPVIAIAYHVKFLEFMNQYGISEYCIDDKSLTTDRLIATYNEIIVNLDSINCQLEQINKRIVLDIKHNFNRMVDDISLKQMSHTFRKKSGSTCCD